MPIHVFGPVGILFSPEKKCEPRPTLPITRSLHAFALTCVLVALAPVTIGFAQAPIAIHQMGTVKVITAGVVTIATAAGAEVSVTIPATARVLQLPPGSTDLKAGTPATLEDIALGDRMLAIGTAGDSALFIQATRIFLMKSSDIATRNAAEQADWQKRGTGGLVKAVDGAHLTVAIGSRTVTIDTTPKTIFKRYAADSVAFEDARLSTLTDLHPGDQLRARGAFSSDHASLTAEEIVSGTFANFSGVVSEVNPLASTLTLKDLSTQKKVMVDVGAKSDLRKLTPDAAMKFAARNAPASAAAGHAAPAGALQAHAEGAGVSSPRRPDMDLAQMLPRLQAQTLADLRVGDSVMIVATEKNAQNPTVLTLLSGVEAILSATPSGGRPLTLLPWNIGEPQGGGGGSQP